MTEIKTVDNLDEYIIDKTLKGLGEKYNKTFVVTHIGNRYDYKSATLYVKDEDDVVFKAVIYSDSFVVEDNYITEKIGHMIKKEMLKELIKHDIWANISIAVMHKKSCNEESDSEISFGEYDNKYNVTELVMYMCIKQDCINDENENFMLDCIKNINSKTDINIGVSAFIIPDEMYVACSGDIVAKPDISNTWFDSYNPITNVQFFISKGKYRPVREEIIEALSRR